MNVNQYNTTAYENKSNWTFGENKPNSNPNKPNCRKGKNELFCVDRNLTVILLMLLAEFTTLKGVRSISNAAKAIDIVSETNISIAWVRFSGEECLTKPYNVL